MSPLLDRISAFFLDPPPEQPPDTARRADHSTSLGFAASAARAAEAAPPRFAPPVPTDPRRAAEAAPPSFAPPVPTHPGGAAEAAPQAGIAAGGAAAPEHAPARSASPRADGTDAASTDPVAAFAVVLGTPAAAVPLAAAAAGELRAQARAAAALVCVWGAPAPPAGASTPAVRRLAARHAGHGGEATACGRLVWLPLDADPDAAATQAVRALAVGGAPAVLAVAGPRPAAFEPLLQEADLAIAVLPADAEQALRALALATLPARAALTLAPLPSGPPRWAAMAGLARLRALEQVRP